jgi:hypothetical protein
MDKRTCAVGGHQFHLLLGPEMMHGYTRWKNIQFVYRQLLNLT